MPLQVPADGESFPAAADELSLGGVLADYMLGQDGRLAEACEAVRAAVLLLPQAKHTKSPLFVDYYLEIWHTVLEVTSGTVCQVSG